MRAATIFQRCFACEKDYNQTKHEMNLRIFGLRLRILQRRPLFCINCSKKEYRKMIAEYCEDFFFQVAGDKRVWIRWKKFAFWYYNFREGAFTEERRNATLNILSGLGILSRDPKSNWEVFLRRRPAQSINPSLDCDRLFFTDLNDAREWAEAYHGEHCSSGSQTCSIRQCERIVEHSFVARPPSER